MRRLSRPAGGNGSPPKRPVAASTRATQLERKHGSEHRCPATSTHCPSIQPDAADRWSGLALLDTEAEPAGSRPLTRHADTTRMYSACLSLRKTASGSTRHRACSACASMPTGTTVEAISQSTTCRAAPPDNLLHDAQGACGPRPCHGFHPRPGLTLGQAMARAGLAWFRAPRPRRHPAVWWHPVPSGDPARQFHSENTRRLPSPTCHQRRRRSQEPRTGRADPHPPRSQASPSIAALDTTPDRIRYAYRLLGEVRTGPKWMDYRVATFANRRAFTASSCAALTLGRFDNRSCRYRCGWSRLGATVDAVGAVILLGALGHARSPAHPLARKPAWSASSRRAPADCRSIHHAARKSSAGEASSPIHSPDCATDALRRPHRGRRGRSLRRRNRPRRWRSSDRPTCCSSDRHRPFQTRSTTSMATRPACSADAVADRLRACFRDSDHRCGV